MQPAPKPRTPVPGRRQAPASGRHQARDLEALDPVRRRIVERIEALRASRGKTKVSLRHASLKIGRSDSYLHAFVWKGSPRKLGEDERRALAVYLDLPETELRAERANAEQADIAPDDAKLFALLAGRLEALYREEQLSPRLPELCEAAYRIHREILAACGGDLSAYRARLDARLERLRDWIAGQRGNILVGKES